jgi:hypothetical protein
MERVLPVKFDTEYVRETRRVRSAWGGWTPGTMIEVSVTSPSGYPQWVSARVERWHSGSLFVTLIERHRPVPQRPAPEPDMIF